jgi:hypothetical protein
MAFILLRPLHRTGNRLTRGRIATEVALSARLVVVECPRFPSKYAFSSALLRRNSAEIYEAAISRAVRLQAIRRTQEFQVKRSSNENHLLKCGIH